MQCNILNLSYSFTLLIFLLASCKPLAQSNLQGVDAITSGDVNSKEQGTCGKVENEGNATSKEERALARVFAALPPILQTFYGGKANALQTVTISGDLTADCTKVLASEPQKEQLLARALQVGSCSYIKEQMINGQSSKLPHIIIKRDADIINGSLLSTYTYLFLGIAIDGALSQNQSDPQITSLVNFLRQIRLEMATNVLSDLKEEKTEKGTLVVDALKKEFGGNDIANSPLFQNFLIGEFAESYYCSPQSYSHLKTTPFKNKNKTWSTGTLENLQAMFNVFGTQQF